jgi:hypothetical protein
MKAGKALFLTLAAALWAAGAIADEVVLKSGRRLSGDVVAKTDASVALQTPYGTVTLDAADVAHVVYATALEKEIRSQLRALPASDTSERLKLAVKAASGGLETLATDIYTQVIAIDGEQAAARKALGYILYEGEWVTPREQAAHPGLVPYQGRWMTVQERERLRQGEVDQLYFASFDLSSAEGAALMARISDIDVSVEPRGGYVVRRHVQSFEARDKPYVFAVSALNWQRLGVFIGVTFIDSSRKRTEGFGELEFTIYETDKDTLGAPRVGRALHTEKVRVKPDMWNKKSDFKYWDSRVSGGYEKIPSDAARSAWESFEHMNYDGIIYVLANRDINLLAPPGVYFVEARLTCGDRQKTVGRFVQYAELR